ncbi:hypothetical protein ILYODFUR_029910 [Ilyodon furcidens]|uniref:Uncharacterized protein n=1 Tax=Ilyodon furcidens TaxID=33524 RepID=A0ABV0UWE5_9TELE
MAASSPTAAEFPAGFGSRPGRHRRRKTVAIGVFRMGASPSTEGPQAMVSSRLFSPELGDGYSAPSAVLQPPVQPPALSWIQAGLEEMKRKFMKNRCCGYVLHLMDHPEDLDLVHSVIQAEFIVEGWLDAPAPLSAGGPFDPLLVAVKAVQSPKYPDPQHAAKPLDSQHAAKLQEPPPAAKLQEPPPAAKLQEPPPAAKLQEPPPAAKPQEPRLIPEEPVGGLVRSTCLVSSGGCYWKYGLTL